MAKHVSDFTKTSDNIVLDLINEQNGTALTLAMIDTKVVGDPDTKTGQLLVTAKPTSGYRGSVALNYNRIMLAEMFGAFIPEGDAVEVDNSMTVAEVIALVNTRYGVNLTEKDIYANGTDLVTGGQTMVDVEFDQVTTLNLSANFMNPLVSSSGVPQLGKVWTGMYGLRLTKTAQALSDACQIRQKQRIAVSWKAGSKLLATMAGTGTYSSTTELTGSFPNYTTISIAGRMNQSESLAFTTNGWFRELRIYKDPVSLSELRAMAMNNR